MAFSWGFLATSDEHFSIEPLIFIALSLSMGGAALRGVGSMLG